MRRNANADRLWALFRNREAAQDWSDLLSRDRQSICRKALLAHCEFPRSTLYQNQSVKRLLQEQEDILRKQNVLQAGVPFSGDPSDSPDTVTLLSERVSGLFVKVACLRDMVSAVADELTRVSQG